MAGQQQGPITKRFYRKRVKLFSLIDKIKLWPSRQGQLHGIRSVEIMGDKARLTTHCNKAFVINNSLNSRAGRWLRNKWFLQVCPQCGVPDWKLKKFSTTLFRRHQGSMLIKKELVENSPDQTQPDKTQPDKTQPDPEFLKSA